MALSPKPRRHAAVSAVIVSTLVMAGFIGVCFLLFTRSMPEGSKDIGLIMLGALASMATTVVSYWLGSSAGSAEKNQILAEKKP